MSSTRGTPRPVVSKMWVGMNNSLDVVHNRKRQIDGEDWHSVACWVGLRQRQKTAGTLVIVSIIIVTRLGGSESSFEYYLYLYEYQVGGARHNPRFNAGCRLVGEARTFPRTKFVRFTRETGLRIIEDDVHAL